MKILVRVPATTANLGPGFDVLGLALDLWNEAEFSLEGQDIHLELSGEGRTHLPLDGRNWIIQAAMKLYMAADRPAPRGLQVRCNNRIPLSSGLGSSAAATLTGLLGANALLGSPFSQDDLLRMATDLEGHPDNAAPALLGGLVAVTRAQDGHIIARQLPVKPIVVTVVTPDFHFPTKVARAALPKQIPMTDAVQNMSRAVLLTQAFAAGDLDLLGEVMSDALHQPYRIPLIPGAAQAMTAAREAGAAAVALSGAGPSLIAFSARRDAAIGESMRKAFAAAGLIARVLPLKISKQGAAAQSGE